MDSIGQRLKYLRKKIGMSQIDMAKRLNVSQNVISLYESDKSSPSTENLLKFAQMGDVTLDWLLTGETPDWSVYTFQMSEDDMIIRDTIEVKYDPNKIKKVDGLWVPRVSRIYATDTVIYQAEDIIEMVFVPYAQDKYFAFTMPDDSMQNLSSLRTINRGDYAIINPKENAISGDAVLLLVNGRPLIRQLEREDERTITVTAWNPTYPEIQFKKEDARAMLRVTMVQPKLVRL